jgi:integration host factor subunit alpha
MAMAGKSVTRRDIANAVYKKVDLSQAKSADLVGQVLKEICDTLAAGETVKLSSFGIFNVRDRAKRVGRNPKTGEVVPVEPHRSITFSASPVLMARMNEAPSLSFSSDPPDITLQVERTA